MGILIFMFSSTKIKWGNYIRYFDNYFKLDISQKFRAHSLGLGLFDGELSFPCIGNQRSKSTFKLGERN